MPHSFQMLLQEWYLQVTEALDEEMAIGNNTLAYFQSARCANSGILELELLISDENNL